MAQLQGSQVCVPEGSSGCERQHGGGCGVAGEGARPRAWCGRKLSSKASAGRRAEAERMERQDGRGGHGTAGKELQPGRRLCMRAIDWQAGLGRHTAADGTRRIASAQALGKTPSCFSPGIEHRCLTQMCGATNGVACGPQGEEMDAACAGRMLWEGVQHDGLTTVQCRGAATECMAAIVGCVLDAGPRHAHLAYASPSGMRDASVTTLSASCDATVLQGTCEQTPCERRSPFYP